MRITGFVACSIVAINCAAKADGLQPQTTFLDGALWLWWVLAAWWAFAACRFIFAERI